MEVESEVLITNLISISWSKRIYVF